MKICFIVNEFFGWGKYGGFGSATRLIATGLAEKGVEVDVVTPIRPGQAPVERDGRLTIRGFRPWSMRDQINACRASDAEIYHSEDPSVGTLLCQHALPKRRHVVTCQDPRTWRDWWIEVSCYLAERRYKSLLTWPYEDNPLIWRAVQKADAVFSEAKHIVPKGQKKYGLKVAPQFLPNPVPLPEGPVVKADRPTVCFVGRFDKRKRPERFFELARSRPDVHFIAVGAANSARMDHRLRQRHGAIANLELTGFLDRFSSPRFAEILARSWVLVNTAAREGLPVTFLEAASYRCAILSQVNPDDFASRFGYHAEAGDFEAGLDALLNGDRWQARGESAYDYVRTTHALEVVIEMHLEAYRALLGGSSASRGAVAGRASYRSPRRPGGGPDVALIRPAPR
jgi:glycosyltransferase involved in cell wall biosynthesis